MAYSLYFITSLLIIIAFIPRLKKGFPSICLIIIAICYSAFCFVAFGKLQGFIPSEPITGLISEQGYDPSRLPVPIAKLIKVGLLCGVAFNLFTAIWILLKGKLWSYCLVSASSFCLVGLILGFFIHLNPLYSLFGVCCGFMASVAWVLGLSYIEFCVIGNIYIPAIAIIVTAIYLLKGCLFRKGLCGKLMSVFGASQIIAVILLLWHYWGGFHYAFYQCVRDLKFLAQHLESTYEAINIYIYVVIIPLILVIDLILYRWAMISSK